MTERDDKDFGLTAAECAARTGLTVRAAPSVRGLRLDCSQAHCRRLALVYEVRRENGVVKWRIALTEGVIVGAAAFGDGP